MLKKELIKEKINFDEENHLYTRNGKEYISVSQLISLFKPPFDPTGSILKKCAEKKGLTPEELQREWDNIKNQANDKGKNFHSDFENYVKTLKIPETINKHLIQKILDFNILSKNLYSETRVFNDNFRIAGTVDLIDLLDKHKINIYDFKTNKRLDKKAKYLPRYMNFPLSNLENCNFSHYSIQLSLYAFMMEDFGYWVNKLGIIYINPRTNIPELHPVPYLRKEVKKILERRRLDLLFEF